MEHTLVYRLWQAPFAERKLRPLLTAHRPESFRRVLDVGCGPGTNAAHFAGTDYHGVDINPAYVRHATKRFGARFQVADVTTMRIEPGQGFDCILVNSLLHHLSDAEVHGLLAHLSSLLAPGGAVHILDLVRPPHASIARFLARHDRGAYPRPLSEWETLFHRHFSPIRFQPYPLGRFGLTLWQMVYFEGRVLLR
jgi:SAM-dependent methyltransferase